MRDALEWRRLGRDVEEPLARFFESLGDADTRFFHPHPFTAEQARTLCREQRKDLYFVLVEGPTVLGYAMLRGWDEGYEIPSLGIIVGPQARGQRLGRLMMDLLHASAARQGAKRIRLKVYPDNLPAVKLYQACGYDLSGSEKGQLVGYVDLP
jgi:ribosomal protein S18 acetylase RimI-like enzyme